MWTSSGMRCSRSGWGRWDSHRPNSFFLSSIFICTYPCSWNNRYLGSLAHPGFQAGISNLAHETVSLYADKCGYRFVLKASPRQGFTTKVIRILKIEMSKDTKLLLHSAIPTLPPSEQMPLHNTSHWCSAEVPLINSWETVYLGQICTYHSHSGV